jgi:hypothetical protein
MDDNKIIFNMLFERTYLNYFIYLCALTGAALLGVTFYTYIHLNKDIDLIMFTVGLFLVSPLLIFIALVLMICCVTCLQVKILKPLAQYGVSST